MKSVKNKIKGKLQLESSKFVELFTAKPVRIKLYNISDYVGDKILFKVWDHIIHRAENDTI